MNDPILEKLTELASLDSTLHSVENLSLKQAISAYITKQSTEVYKLITEQK